MQITTQFDLGQTVYVIASLSAPNWVPCAFCAADGHIEGRDGQTRGCPECYGKRGRNEWLPLAWRVQDGPLTVGQVRVEVTRAPGLAGKEIFHNFTAQEGGEEKYMLVETGIGSGSLWSAGDLFATVDEAEAACTERNEARDAELDRQEFNDPREQARLQDEADLRFEYSRAEYEDYGPEDDGDDDD